MDSHRPNSESVSTTHAFDSSGDSHSFRLLYYKNTAFSAHFVRQPIFFQSSLFLFIFKCPVMNFIVTHSHINEHSYNSTFRKWVKPRCSLCVVPQPRAWQSLRPRTTDLDTENWTTRQVTLTCTGVGEKFDFLSAAYTCKPRDHSTKHSRNRPSTHEDPRMPTQWYQERTEPHRTKLVEAGVLNLTS